MKPYAYFPNDKSKPNKAITLFSFIDKKIQGENIPTFQTVADFNLSNIYLKDGFNKLLESYFSSLYEFIDLLAEKYSFGFDIEDAIDLFFPTMKPFVSEINYLKEKEYLVKENWKRNKRILMENKNSTFFHLSKKIMELFFLIGLKTNISFYECSYYVNTMAHLPYTTPQKKHEKIRDIKSLQIIIDKDEDLQSISYEIMAYGVMAHLEQKEVIKSLNNIILDAEELNQIKKRYFNLLLSRNDLMSYINKIYYECGTKEQIIEPIVSAKEQREENKKQFNAPTAMVIDVDFEQDCLNCGEHNDILYNINLYTPSKHTVSSLCINCLLSVANNLNEAMRLHYTSYRISSQLMVNYQHRFRPFAKCNHCGKSTTETFEIVTVRDYHTTILCEDCANQLIKLIDKKRSGHNTLKMKLKNSNQKT